MIRSTSTFCRAISPNKRVATPGRSGTRNKATLAWLLSNFMPSTTLVISKLKRLRGVGMADVTLVPGDSSKEDLTTKGTP